MKKTVLALALAAALLAWHTPAVQGQDVAELKKEIEQQYDVLLRMQTRLLQLEQQQEKTSKAVSAMAAAPAASAAAPGEVVLPEALQWLERVKLYGDLRYRYEYTDDEQASATRNRNRIRARIGVDFQINDDWSMGVRLASGSEDPVSTNATLDNSFSSKDVWLDLAFIDWHPSEEFNATLGKMKNPFYRVGGNQLIYDGDLNPEGIAASYTMDWNENLAARITGGGFWLDERSSNADTSLWGVQGLIEAGLEDGSELLVGASYYDYGNIEGRSLPVVGLEGNTPTVPGGSLYAYDYNLVEGFAEYGFTAMEMPVAVYGSYVVNTAGDVDEDTGWMIGAQLGKTKEPGSWALLYDYRDLEADAVFAGFTESDFADGMTNSKGHRFGAAYQIARNVTGALTYYLAEYQEGGTEYDFDRLQVDLQVKF